MTIPASAAPYAAFVMDARTGEVLYEKNADKRLHPASLTKMMTLYLVFQAVESGKLNLDQLVTISAKAASQPPSRLGLKTGQKIALRYLIRAAAVKSANDAATALGETVSGSTSAFADLMNETAQAMGMTNTTFRNANGLTQDGHLSTARDMAILGRRVFYDFPQYYNIFSREQTSAGVTEVANTNRRFLENYEGADGIKTGYTVAAGFNLVASAQRGQVRIIASMFGGTSTAQRNAQVAKLLDLGFKEAPRLANVQKLPRLRFPDAAAPVETASSTRLATSTRPRPRPGVFAVQVSKNYDGMADAVATALEQALVDGDAAPAIDPGAVALSGAENAALDQAVAEAAAPIPFSVASLAPTQSERPRARSRNLASVAVAAVTVSAPAPVEAAAPVGDWSVQLGAYRNRGEAEKLLLTTALQDQQAFEGADRQIETVLIGGVQMFRARFAGLSQDNAENACARLAARLAPCETISPGS